MLEFLFRIFGTGPLPSQAVRMRVFITFVVLSVVLVVGVIPALVHEAASGKLTALQILCQVLVLPPLIVVHVWMVIYLPLAMFWGTIQRFVAVLGAFFRCLPRLPAIIAAAAIAFVDAIKRFCTSVGAMTGKDWLKLLHFIGFIAGLGVVMYFFWHWAAAVAGHVPWFGTERFWFTAFFLDFIFSIFAYTLILGVSGTIVTLIVAARKKGR
jgi:hypothetical protein